MGKNNQQRRADKRKARAANLAAAARGGRASSQPAAETITALAPERSMEPDVVIAGLLESGAELAFGPSLDEVRVERVIQCLVGFQSPERDRPLLPAELATDGFNVAVGVLWENGWQPLDLVHVVRRHQGTRGAALVTAVITEQARLERAVERAPADWAAQLASLGISAAGPTGNGPRQRLITEWQRTQGIATWDGWHDILKLIGQLQTLHRLTPLGPPPSQWDRLGATDSARMRRPSPDPTRHHADAGGHDPRMLGKIRALLSKAEASTFTEEADAFTSKAQDLMTRYAIDEALLEDSEGHGDVLTRRIHIDNPYAQAKVQLLSTVGGINRVRVIWDDHHGMATAVGMAIDLELVEMLFTSLLVQATRSLTEAGNSRTTEGYQSGRLNRSPSFRRAFLLAYANRIGERLEAAGTAASTEATSSHGAELVPMLARRAKAVDTTFDRLFPETRQTRAKQVDARGWHAGRAAADKAVFASGQVESA
jgi:hypothetical protein